MLRTFGFTIVCAILAVGCDGGSSNEDEYCPDFSQEIDESRRIADPPDLEAESGGDSVRLSAGPSEWCHIVSDQFEVVTGHERLAVKGGDRVEIRNPKDDGLVSSSIVIQGPQPEPIAGEGGRLTWTGAAWTSGGPTDIEDSLEFDAPDESGVYIVTVDLTFEQVGTPEFAAARDAAYAFVLEVDAE